MVCFNGLFRLVWKILRIFNSFVYFCNGHRQGKPLRASRRKVKSNPNFQTIITLDYRMIQIKRNFTNFYIQIIIICVICLIGSFPFAYKIYRILEENQTRKGLEILIATSLFMHGIGFYSVYQYFKKVPTITLKEKALQLRTKR